MTDLIDVPDETVEEIARRMVDDETLLVHTKPLVRSVLAAALPVLRAQIEAEIRAQVADEIEDHRLAYGEAGDRIMGFAAWLARGEKNG